jgi:hypothetical protein
MDAPDDLLDLLIELMSRAGSGPSSSVSPEAMI